MIQTAIIVCLVLILAHTLQARRLKWYAGQRREAGERLHDRLMTARSTHLAWERQQDEKRRTEKGRLRAMESIKS